MRHAIITLGHGVRTHEPDFAHHRLAFAMMRTQAPCDPDQWVAAVEKGRAVKAAKAT